jgi:hypothetical protein
MPDAPDPFIEPIIEHGIKPSGIVDEDGALILSLDLNPMRDEVESKGDTRAVQYVRNENPRLEGEFSLRPRRNALGQYYGFGDMHPGAAVTDLANLPYNGSVHGFRITASMSIIMGNPKRAMGDDGVTITQPFKVMPFVKSATAIAAMAA